MDLTKIQTIANDPKRTRSELEQMLSNAKTKGNFEVLGIISTVLQTRFPLAQDAIDRSNPAVAREILESWFPKVDARRQILNRLIDSARIANAISPSAWAVTLSSDFFRLNVGPVEVYVAYPGGFFINCAGSIDIAPFNGPGFETVSYKSMPGPNCVYRGKPNDLTKLPKDVLQAHAMFIDNASTTSTGKPRTGTLYRKSHSEGLIKYARLAMKE